MTGGPKKEEEEEEGNTKTKASLTETVKPFSDPIWLKCFKFVI